MSHLHRGRLIRLRKAKTDKQRAAVLAYSEKPAPEHVAIGAPAPRARAKAKRSRK